MKKLIIVMLILNLYPVLIAQENSPIYSKWYFKPAAGVNLPVTKLLTGEISDYLLEYDDYSWYGQLIAGGYFFNSTWGLEFSFQPGYSGKLSGRAEKFANEVELEYGDSYFVTVGSSAAYSQSDFSGGTIQRGYLGLVYRIEKPHIVILPKFSIGVTSFYTDFGSATLKEKGTNTLLKLRYESGQRPNDHLTLAPSVTIGYRLSKRVLATMDAMYSYYKTDIVFTEELRNTFTEEVSNRSFEYRRQLNTFSLGLGLIVEFYPNRR